MSEKLKIIFLCTGNSCKNHMVEGRARHLKSNEIEAYSAGIEKHGLNPLAVKIMAEAWGMKSGRSSKDWGGQFRNLIIPFDLAGDFWYKVLALNCGRIRFRFSGIETF